MTVTTSERWPTSRADCARRAGNAQIHGKKLHRTSFWTRASVPLLSAAFGALCTLIALLVPMAKYQNFLLLIGSVFAPLFGVVLMDHFIVRRRIDAAVLADVRGRYGFSGGWHLSAFVAWALGIASYQMINQWRPSLAIGALCYYVFVSARKTAHA